MLHYATPALSHLYFVDPQWLCDMLAHVVTVPEVNSFIPRKDGLYIPLTHRLCNMENFSQHVAVVVENLSVMYMYNVPV